LGRASTGSISKSVSRDKKDDKILQCGLDGNVDYIVTGDKDLLVLKEYETIKIINPKDYLETV
jgi:predicted nucleic acid-binding protein